MMDTITFHEQDGRTFVSMLWPKVVRIDDVFLKRNIVKVEGMQVIINVANGEATYEQTERGDHFGIFMLLDSSYQQMTYTT